MANEDSLLDQGDIAAPIIYDPRNIPMGQGYAQQQTAAAAPTVQTKGWTAQFIITNVAALTVLPADPNRKFVLIQNADALGDIFVAFGVVASAALGIRIAAGGGAILLDNNVPTAAISIIGNIAANPFVTVVSA